MSATTQVTTFLDLVTDLLNRARHDTTATATVNQAKRYINTALFDMHIGYGEKFPWAERSATLTTHPTYSEGTVILFAAGSNVSGTGTLWDTNNAIVQKNVRAGGQIQFAGQREIYDVGSVTSDILLTLDTQVIYMGGALAAATYLYFENEYALATDFLRPIDQNRFTDGPRPIGMISRTEFRRQFHGYTITGRPEVATMIDASPSGGTVPRRRVRLYPAPDQAYQIRYTYVTANLVTSAAGAAQEQLSADTDEPIVPIRYRHVIVLHALYHWYRDKKDDTRSQEARGEYLDLLTRITGDNEIGSVKPSLSPRVSRYGARARRPWSSGLGRFDVDGRFDRLDDL